jgi:hypothetical protein
VYSDFPYALYFCNIGCQSRKNSVCSLSIYCGERGGCSEMLNFQWFNDSKFWSYLEASRKTKYSLSEKYSNSIRNYEPRTSQTRSTPLQVSVGQKAYLCCVFCVLCCSVTSHYSVLLFFFCVLYCSLFLYCTVSACDVRAATLT